MPVICTHPPETLERLTEGCWCGVCGQRVWPPLYRRDTTTARAWAGDLVAPEELEKYEEGVGTHAAPREIIGE